MKGLHEEIFLRAGTPDKKKRVLFNYFKDGWKTLTSGEFIETASAISAHLIEIGIKKGDRVAIVSENRYEWCAAFLGSLSTGAVCVPIDAGLKPDEIKAIIRDSEARLIFSSNLTLLSLKDVPDVPVFNFDEAMLHIMKPGGIAPSEGLAALFYTSGTTGVPKAVMLSHENLLSDAFAVIETGVIKEGDNVLSALPLHHTYSLMCTFIVPVMAGAEITYPASLKGTDLISAIKDKGVTIFVSVPRMLELIRGRIMERLHALPAPLGYALFKCLRASGFMRRKWDINIGKVVFHSVIKTFGDRLKYITSGGARLEPEIMEDLEALGFTVLEGYGLTETSPVAAFNPAKTRKPGSVGLPLKTAEIKILNPSQTGEGEVAIKGPMVMQGYYKNPEATAGVLKDSHENIWFLSGDLGYVDNEGYLFLTGRLKDMIVLPSGKNIYPEEVEKAYAGIPLIKEMCVMEKGGRLAAVIVPDTEYAKKEKIGNINEALRWEVNQVSHDLPSHMRLMGYTLYPEPLPKTPLGKLRRFLIKDLSLKPELPEAEDKTLTEDETGRTVLKCLLPLLEDKRQVQSSDNLELDLGLDSLRRLELTVSLEQAFSIKLDEGFISGIQTVGDIVERMGEKAPQVLAGRLKENVPSDEGKKQAGFTASKVEWYLTACLMCLVKLALKLVFRLEVRGSENIPEPPFIIASNHASYLDGFVLGAGVPLRVFKTLYFQGFQKYFRGRLTSLFARLSHVISIDPETYLQSALRLSAYALKTGHSLAVFPEGGRSFDKRLMPFKKGIAMLSLPHNVPVVPARIEGTFQILPRGAKWPKLGKIRLTFGKPVTPSEVDITKKEKGVDEYQFFADILRDKVERTGQGQ